MHSIVLHVNPEVTNEKLNVLFAAAWPDHIARNYLPILQRSLAYVCAYSGEQLVGFVNVAWDGGVHAFLLDTMVHPEMQRRGIGTKLVKQVIEVVKARDIVWLHVDYEPHLEGFYKRCGFQATRAGLIHVSDS